MIEDKIHLARADTDEAVIEPYATVDDIATVINPPLAKRKIQGVSRKVRGKRSPRTLSTTATAANS